MIRRILVSPAVLLCTAAAMAHPPSDDARTAKTWSVDGAVADRSRAEDLHILATIVTENVHGLYGIQPRVAGGTDATGPQQSGELGVGAWLYIAGGHPQTTAGPTRAVGEYLPDYGVVVQMEVPSPHEPVTKKASAAEKPRPPSRWERTRQKLAGETGASAFEQAMCSNCHDAGVTLESGNTYLKDYDRDGDVDLYLAKGGVHPAPTRKQLADRLIETLAENGHNLRNVEPSQRVTLSLSWQPAHASDASRRFLNMKRYKSEGDGKFKRIDDNKPKPAAPKGSNSPGGSDSSGGSPGNAPITPSDGNAAGPPRSNAELTGDLLLTKGRYAEAVRAFEQAIDGLQAEPQPPAGAADQKRAIAVKLAFAQAAMAAGAGGGADGAAPKTSDPNSADSRVVEYEKAFAAQIAFQTGKPRSSMPGRISVTATKAQLDQVASGKLTRQQFAKQVIVRGFEPAGRQ